VLIGSLLNARAVAQQLTEYNKVLLLCAGTRGQFSLEDTLAAGWVIKELLALKGGENYSGRALAAERAQGQQVYRAEVPLDIQHDNMMIMDDYAVVAYRLALFYQRNTLDALYDSLHGQKLAQLDMTEDLNFCSQINVTEVVPHYHAGVISTQLAI
jgi:2-phosphosulfolactate phosphatase